MTTSETPEAPTAREVSPRALPVVLSVAVAAVVAAIVLATIALPAASRASSVDAVPGGDPGRGAQVMSRTGCGSCHTIPGIEAANGHVGPPLDAWSQRQLIAGHVPNDPPNLIRWLEDPPSIEPGTAMPDLGLSHDEARDVAAYLFTLAS